MRVFVDTSAFIALEDREDVHHREAFDYRDEVKANRIRLVTTNFIMDEALTWLRMGLSLGNAIAFRERVVSSAVISVERVTSGIEEEAWDIFCRYQDKSFSYTDCTSFAAMAHLGLDTAFAFDRHFEQFGYTRVP